MEERWAVGVPVRFGVEAARLCEKDEGMWVTELLLSDRCCVDACDLQMAMTLPCGLSEPLDQASGR